jgi:hypothetical protein
MSKPMAYSLLILGFMILSAGLFFALKTFKPMHFNLIAGLIAVLITVFALFGRLMQDKSSSEKSDLILKSGEQTGEKIDSLKFQNAELNTKLEKQSETIDNLRKENTDLHSKLSQVSGKIYSKVTGGDSYCVVKPMFSDNENPKYLIQLIGDVALKEVQISIDDIGRRASLLNSVKNIDEKIEEIFQILEETKYSFSMSLYPETARILSIPMEVNQRDIDLLIRIYQDNGTTEQLLKVPEFRSKNRKIENTVKRNNISLPLH